MTGWARRACVGRRLAAGLAVVGALAILGTLALVPPASAHATAHASARDSAHASATALPRAAALPCGNGSGVTVVVDATAVGGTIQTRCAPSDPADGVTALRTAGFAVAGTARWGDAFVCRIDGAPSAASEPCIDTPPAGAYWSYWHATRGGTWRYSQLGARAYNPAPGTVEGWSFGAGGAPGVAPPPAPAQNPTSPQNPTSSQNPAPSQNPQPGQPPPGPGAGLPVLPGPTGPVPASDSGSHPAGIIAGAPAPIPSSIVEGSRPAAAALGDAGSTLLGIGIVVALAAVAAVIALRRRVVGRGHDG